MEQNRSRRQGRESSYSESSEAQIAVHWQEENYFSAPKDFTAQANLTDKGVFKRFALEKFPGYYKEFAELLDWYKKWDKIFDGSKPPFWRWFVGGKINASYNCVDRHLAKHRNKAAIHFVPEPEHEEKADIAVAEAAKDGHQLEKVLVWQRHAGKYSSQAKLVEGRDFVVNDLLPKYRGKRIDPVQMPADAPLFLMYTSGTTGKPKGAQHSIGGYLAYVTWTSKYVQDI